MSGPRKALAAAGLLCLAAPVAVAEKLPPHSDFYDQHPMQHESGNDVGLLVYRTKGRADLYVTNFCLGKQPGPPPYPNQAMKRSARVRHGRIDFQGSAVVYTPSGQHFVKLRFKAKIAARSVTGTAQFPDTAGCTTIRFTARRTGHTA